MDTMQGTDPTRVIGRRFGAFVIDWVLLATVVPVLIFLAVSQPTVYTDEPSCSQLERIDLVSSGDICIEATSGSESGTYVFPPSGLIVAGAFLVVYLVGVLWLVQGTSGRTVGKVLFGLRTVDRDGASPGLGRQLLRGVLWLVDSINCLIPLGAIFILATKRHQRIGDLAAGTFVVRASAAGMPVPPAPSASPTYTAGGIAPTPYPATPPAGSSPYPAGPPLAAPAPTFHAPEPGAAITVPEPATTATDATTTVPTTAEATDATTIDTAPGYGAPDSGAPGYGAPGHDATTVQPTVQPQASAGGPQWDPARNAYIQWDQARQTWLVYDDAAGEWKAIS